MSDSETEIPKSDTPPPNNNNNRKSGLLRWFDSIKFQNKLALISLFVALIPLIGFAFFSLNSFRQFSIRTAEEDLAQTAKSMLMLCEAQEALDRLSREKAAAADAVSGASPSWQDGNEFKSLHVLIKGVRVAETGYAYVFDSVGLVVIHPTLEGQNYNKMEPAEKEVFTTMRDKARALPVGEIGTYRYPWPDAEGDIKTKIAKFIYFQPYDWIIGVAAHEEEILQPYYRDRIIFDYILLATVVLVVLLVYGVSRFLMRTIRQLTQATALIAEGDFSVKVPQVESKDEIGSLARSFRLMIVKLRHAHNDLLEWSKTLEQKVEERTLELEKAHERMLMSQKMASLGNLSAMVAHEINNPLSGILSYLKLTSKLLGRVEIDEKLRETVNHNLDVSTAEVKRVGTIVRNLLMFSKQTFGEFGRHNLCPLIDKSIALIQHSLDVKGMTLNLEVDCLDKDRMFCDPSGIQQMLVALGMNAIDAMEQGGKLTIRATLASEQEVQLQVIDTGHGIPDSALPHIFEPFFSTKEDKKSIGMGLAVVYGIVHSHYGSIRVNSQAGEGTTFTITLPREKPEGATEAQAEGDGKTTESEGEQ